MKVGGRDFDESHENVARKMRGVTPDAIQKHVVEINEIDYPPKQVLAHVTGWPRTSFTTMEAQRVLRALGFYCREVGMPRRCSVRFSSDPTDRDRDRIGELEAAIVTSQEAIAGLSARVRTLEQRMK